MDTTRFAALGSRVEPRQIGRAAPVAMAEERAGRNAAPRCLPSSQPRQKRQRIERRCADDHLVGERAVKGLWIRQRRRSQHANIVATTGQVTGQGPNADSAACVEWGECLRDEKDPHAGNSSRSNSAHRTTFQQRHTSGPYGARRSATACSCFPSPRAKQAGKGREIAALS